jgi:alkanesulfonate monooxygenase SsuD/methylene tetrahydromethanopterin reductase-like flavin-dependent oxidoreductase (luciferase family)
VLLGFLAGRTKRIRLGHGVTLTPHRFNHPIRVAERVAALDILSDGRVDWGSGKSSSRVEQDLFEVDRGELASQWQEAFSMIPKMWRSDVFEWQGKHYHIPPTPILPKPVQKPHPPVIVGGAFPYSARRAIRYGDGWIPQASRGSYTEIADMIPEFRKMATAAGRDPASIEITVWFPKREADLMKRYEDLGVKRVVFSLESEKADTILPVVDAWEKVMRQTNG